MDVVRRFGWYIVAGVLLLAAAVFYLLVVNRAAAERSRKMAAIDSHAGDLKTYAGRQLNEKLVEVTRAAYEQEARNLDACDEFLVNQPRECHTRWFFQSEDPTHPDYGKMPVGEVHWLTRYTAAMEKLHNMLFDAWMTDWIQTPAPWGDRLPTKE